MTTSDRQVTDCADTLLGQIANEFFDAKARGETPQIDDYVQKYPDLEEMIRELFPALDLVGDSSSSPPDSEFAGAKQLGDFRIIREIGRGGMGVVYEAEQMSLGRSVALKVLPYAAVMDQKAITRFKNEARAAATLDHPNIVPVYAVGNERSVYFYAMSLINGQTLSDVIGHLRHSITEPRNQSSPLSIDELLAMGSSLAESAVDSQLEPTIDIGRAEHHPAEDRHHDAEAPTFRDVQAAVETHHSRFSASHFRACARLGVQAAEALEHAHQHGIVHRDIKPGNLMIDLSSKLWITDFGLARIQSDPGMTMTGDLVGTLRYMPPEQALAKRVVVDHRADIYALGVTLYELLTLERRFVDETHQANIAHDSGCDSRSARDVNPSIPRELETVVQKATADEPDQRYATAGELADDLQRFLESEPAHRQQLNRLGRVAHWSSQHKLLAGTVSMTSPQRQACLVLINHN